MAVKLGSITEIINAQLQGQYANSVDTIGLITEQLVARMKEEQGAQAVNFDRVDLTTANREKARLLNFKGRIANNVSAAAKAKNAIEWTTQTLGKMKTDLTALLGSTDPAARTAAASAFNTDRNNIDSKVDGANQMNDYININLVGNTSGPGFTTDDLYSPSGPTGGGVMIEGAYLGTRFNIQDASGFLWRYSEATDEYVQYVSDSTQAKTGTTIAAAGLTVTSYDHATGAVVLGGSGSLSGTVVKGGVGLLSSEYYSDFVDDVAVQQAITDVDAAIVIANSKGFAITADTTIIEGSVKLINDRVAKLDKQAAKILQEEFKDSSARSKAANLNLIFAINNLNILSQSGSGLVENLIASTANQEPARGLLGLMGL
ncbi:MAG: hypothetical protein HQ503_02920 [Rhodospirillales bacterium]|nr:hypothetical protein [Rhodospirillales bacterium]